MRARLSHARISPKKANLIASMVRGLTVREALATLERLPKKGARMLHALISSAVANAEHNASQQGDALRIRTLSVTKGMTFKRFIPMARGRARPIDKMTSHMIVELGVSVPDASSKESVAEQKKVKREKGQKKVKKEGADQDIVYSEKKPVAHDAYTNAPGLPSEDATPGSSAGSSQAHPTFKSQRKGGRGD